MPEYRGRYQQPTYREVPRSPYTQRVVRSDANSVRMLDDYSARKPQSKSKTIALTALVIVVAAALVYSGFQAYKMLSNPVIPSNIEAGIPVTVIIPDGATTSEIARILSNAGVISDENLFKRVAIERNIDASLKPGRYTLVTGMDLDELFPILVSGPVDEVTQNRLTIPEGLTVEQTAARVEAACGIPASEFLEAAYSADRYFADYPFLAAMSSELYNNSLEGFLYPKTYAVSKDATADTVIRILLNQFVIETANLDLSYATSRNLTFFDVVTAASLIERETAAESERALVASVIYNRLRIGMRLQIDATVVYALGPTYDYHPLTYDDLKVDSPYNTYLVQQLPAGPICSPQIASIIAAAHPAETDYIYYVLTSKEGFHTFCSTAAEFEEAKRKYMEIFGIS